MTTSANNTQKNTGTNTVSNTEDQTREVTETTNTTDGTARVETQQPIIYKLESDYPQQPIAGGSYASGATTGDSTTSNTPVANNETDRLAL
jgi:hypothetical protein